jgi:TonB family protein
MPTRLPALFLLLACWASPAPAQEAAPAPLQVSSSVMGSFLIKRVAPVYPPLARQARVQGTVVLTALLSKTGDVKDVQLISGHPMLAPAAIEAVKQWKYQPYLLNGEAAEVETTIQVNFKISDKPVGVVGDSPGGLSPGSIGSLANPAPPSAENDQLPRVSEAVMRPLRIQQVDPVYPLPALQNRIEGQVILNAVIDASGDVKSLSLISGHPMLAPAAIEAVKQWRYKPYLLNGELATVQTMIHINFALSHENDSQGAAIDTPFDSIPPPPRRIRVSAGVAQLLLLSKVNPEYPADAKAQGIQGLVLLKVNIDETGHVVQVELINGDPALAQAAIDAVKQWAYHPYLLNGTPIAVETQVKVNFTLAGN